MRAIKEGFNAVLIYGHGEKMQIDMLMPENRNTAVLVEYLSLMGA